jgi:hypothetical protein
MTKPALKSDDDGVSYDFSSQSKMDEDSRTEGWQKWTIDICTMKLKRHYKQPEALLRLSDLLCT